VARIAYLSSDVIVSVQPAQSLDSEFSSHLLRYAGRKDKSLVASTEDNVPEVRGSIAPLHNVSTNGHCRSNRFDIMQTLFSQYSPQFDMADLSLSPPAPPSLSHPYHTSTD
jgi:hypothetical protein